ncbi:MAG: hypothetical protein WCR46_15190 [Deltaproteobacteria bacterium]|jgi:hypothetical protein
MKAANHIVSCPARFRTGRFDTPCENRYSLSWWFSFTVLTHFAIITNMNRKHRKTLKAIFAEQVNGIKGLLILLLTCIKNDSVNVLFDSTM